MSVSFPSLHVLISCVCSVIWLPALKLHVPRAPYEHMTHVFDYVYVAVWDDSQGDKRTHAFQTQSSLPIKT